MKSECKLQSKKKMPAKWRSKEMLTIYVTDTHENSCYLYISSIFTLHYNSFTPLENYLPGKIYFIGLIHTTHIRCCPAEVHLLRLWCWPLPLSVSACKMSCFHSFIRLWFLNKAKIQNNSHLVTLQTIGRLIV